uniref:Uncharacterized protein n=1 Tax=Steinernema glaseri TaxID=37863 RepID=A0A1I8AC42_9BILA
MHFNCVDLRQAPKRRAIRACPLRHCTPYHLIVKSLPPICLQTLFFKDIPALLAVEPLRNERISERSCTLQPSCAVVERTQQKTAQESASKWFWCMLESTMTLGVPEVPEVLETVTLAVGLQCLTEAPSGEEDALHRNLVLKQVFLGTWPQSDLIPQTVRDFSRIIILDTFDSRLPPNLPPEISHLAGVLFISFPEASETM